MRYFAPVPLCSASSSCETSHRRAHDRRLTFRSLDSAIVLASTQPIARGGGVIAQGRDRTRHVGSVPRQNLCVLLRYPVGGQPYRDVAIKRYDSFLRLSSALVITLHRRRGGGYDIRLQC